jgi:hypothetical protein
MKITRFDALVAQYALQGQSDEFILDILKVEYEGLTLDNVGAARIRVSKKMRDQADALRTQ